MEKIKQYRIISKKLIAELGNRKNQASHGLKYQVINDDGIGNYLLLRNGWKGSSRFYGIIVHIEVTDKGKVWLHQDNTDLIIADMLLERGVSESDLVLGFHPPAMREETGMAPFLPLLASSPTATAE